MDNGYGYDPERDRWSRRASELLFPSIAKSVFNTSSKDIAYTWNMPEIDRAD